MWQQLLRLGFVSIVLGSCGSYPGTGPVRRIPCDGPPVPLAAKAPDFRDAGPEGVTPLQGKVPDVSPTLAFTRFQPASSRSEVLVVLGHGFMRNRSRMAGLATHLAGWGLDVVTVDFRFSRPWNAHHDRNAEDMTAVARHLKAKRVIYCGFSAGGLAALLAAAADPSVIGFLGLDLVDDGNGAKAAAALRFPMPGLIGEPASCNANGNGLRAFAAANNSRVLRVDAASHCHFEFPLDPLCEFVCGKGAQRHATADIQRTILGLTTASLLWQSGADPKAKEWWTSGGEHYELLRGAGSIREVK